jgi:Protein of unknown function (DUF3309)
MAVAPLKLDEVALNLGGDASLLIVIILLIAALPTWPYSAGWGYYPGGILGLILIIVIVLLLLGRL